MKRRKKTTERPDAMPAETCVRRAHGRMWFGRGSAEWSIADPEAIALEESMHALRYAAFETITSDDLMRVLEAAEAYVHLMLYPLRTVTARQFATIRRELRRTK